ncbi:MAG: AAA family ATPase, partial [Deltaproteobacteria bacterium]|nr:AAA family ATPase [Deltaproteobacteria bacterium]
MIKQLILSKFTAFESLDLEFSPGVNIFIGENDTGKTHILKVIYSACDITSSKKSFAEKLVKVFLPSAEQPGRLVKRAAGDATGSVELYRLLPETGQSINIKLSMTRLLKKTDEAVLSGAHKQWLKNPLKSVYVPVKDMLANAPGFIAMYEKHDLHFEEVYPDILYRAFWPLLRDPIDDSRQQCLEMLQTLMGGFIEQQGEEFFLNRKRGVIEFTLLAEGFRKLALLWLLIQNGTLSDGAVLCWDEPETNLNPRMMQPVVKILIGLQRLGVQIFLSTHNYVILKEFDLQ